MGVSPDAYGAVDLCSHAPRIERRPTDREPSWVRHGLQGITDKDRDSRRGASPCALRYARSARATLWQPIAPGGDPVGGRTAVRPYPFAVGTRGGLSAAQPIDFRRGASPCALRYARSARATSWQPIAPGGDPDGRRTAVRPYPLVVGTRGQHGDPEGRSPRGRTDAIPWLPTTSKIQP